LAVSFNRESEAYDVEDRILSLPAPKRIGGRSGASAPQRRATLRSTRSMLEWFPDARRRALGRVLPGQRAAQGCQRDVEARPLADLHVVRAPGEARRGVDMS
jgi:hypothetical protein